MKYSGMNRCYSTSFDTWSQAAAQVYSEVNAVLSQVSGEQMVSHEIFDNGVRRVEYGSGVAIYIKYSDRELEADGVSVPALGYTVKQGVGK